MVCCIYFDVGCSAVVGDGLEGQESVRYKLSDCVVIME